MQTACQNWYFGVLFMRRVQTDEPDHASFNADGSVGYFDGFHVEENRFLFVVSRLRQQRMQQDATSGVD